MNTLFEVNGAQPTTKNAQDDFKSRWDMHVRQGILSRVDEGIAAMVSLSHQAMSSNGDERLEALDDLEAAAFATTLELQKLLAFKPGRRMQYPFDPGRLLVNAVRQYTVHFQASIRQAILDGAVQGRRCVLDDLKDEDVLPAERCYLEWVTVAIKRHLVLFN